MQQTQITPHRIRVVIFGAVAAIVVVLAFFFYATYGNTANESVLQSDEFGPINDEIAAIPDGYGGIDVGDVAPDFSVVNLAGESVALSDYAGQPVMLNFWATWCAPCRIEMPELQAVYEANRDSGFVILALNQNESADVVAAYFQDEMGLTFPALLDESHRVAAEYGVYGINPSSLFISGDGIVTARHFGPATAKQIEGYLADILPGN